MRATIALLPGDGIGPEVAAAATSALRAVGERFGHRLEIDEAPVGGAAIDACGEPLPASTRAACERADAVLLGAVGGPRWSDPGAAVRPEQGLLELRRALGVFANLRPVQPLPALRGASPLRPELLENVDLVVVRELTGGIYFGDKQEGGETARDVCEYSREEIARIVRLAAQTARGRRGKLTSVDKANVLATSRLWRTVASEVVAGEFPELELDHLLVDAAAMHLLNRPSSFDVIVTENMFGDILTDEASMLAGSLGMLPSASLGADRRGLYEPIHGSAPDIAGRGVANPCGMLASAAMLLRHSLGLETEAAALEQAIRTAIETGARTADIAAGSAKLTTTEMTERVLDALAGASLAQVRELRGELR